ncbi:MAG: DUF4358 domain-containing protein [Ruminococcus sp.]|jgi:hypothetical protein|nr:DUF4358 domain-containing protein [Ruminococcus sp.]
MSKIKSSGISLVFILLLVITVGCGNTEEIIAAPAPADVTAAVMSEVEFMSPVPKTIETIGVYYTILDTSSVSDMSVYVCGSGAYPDEIAVIEFIDSEAADKGFEAVTDRLDTLIKTYTDYTPEEMYKLDSAVLEKRGNYVIFIVADDNEKALEITDRMFS